MKQRTEAEDMPLMTVTKGLAALLAEYRHVSGRIVARHAHNRYVLTGDRERLAHLNSKIDEMAGTLQKSLDTPSSRPPHNSP